MEPIADLIYYHEAISPMEYKVKNPPARNPKQMTLWFQLESPLNTVEIPTTVGWFRCCSFTHFLIHSLNYSPNDQFNHSLIHLPKNW